MIDGWPAGKKSSVKLSNCTLRWSVIECKMAAAIMQSVHVQSHAQSSSSGLQKSVFKKKYIKTKKNNNSKIIYSNQNKEVKCMVMMPYL